MKFDLYQSITDKILVELQNGAAPWVKPWSATGGGSNIPQNAVSNRPYSGINVILLWMAGQAYPTPRYLTFKQAKEAGGSVKKGEHGHHIVFVKPLTKTKVNANGDQEDKSILMMKSYVVFNVAQCEGLPERIVNGPVEIKVRNTDQRDALADEFVRDTGAVIVDGGAEAYYRPGSDSINLPRFEAFKGADHFYGTSFHELIHWSGHKTRLDRDLRGRFDQRAYAAEELIAELGAAFLCAEFGFDGDLRHAGYLQSWIELLKDDRKAFFTAASKAQQAADYLRGLALASPGEVWAEAAE